MSECVRARVCAHMCVREVRVEKSQKCKAGTQRELLEMFHVERQKLMCSLQKFPWLCGYFTQGAPFCVHLERYAIVFLTEFHVLVTGGWTNPQKIACNTQSLTHFEYCFYHTESAHAQLKGYETS